MEDIVEILAELEHEQWMEWSKNLVATEKRLSMNRIERWKKLWVPYAELTEEQKEQDRIYARKVLEAIKVEGVECCCTPERKHNHCLIHGNVV